MNANFKALELLVNDVLLTKKQAFEAMRNFLEKFYRQTSSNGVDLLLGEMQILGDGLTADPATWSEWVDAIEQVLNKI